MKTFRINPNVVDDHIEALTEYCSVKLSYAKNIVKASPSIDIWSFGVLLYHLCAGESFLPVNRDYDLRDADCMQNLARMTNKDIEQKINGLNIGKDTETVKDLLRKLLSVKANERPESMDSILQHPFFTGGSVGDKQDDILNKLDTVLNKQDLIIENLQAISAETLKQLKCTEKVLLRGIFDAVEVSVPSCFTIVNQLLTSPSSTTPNDDTDTSNENEISNARWSQQIQGFIENIYTFYECMIDMTAAANSQYSPDEILNSLISKLCEEQTLYLYLVDEYTMKQSFLREKVEVCIRLKSKRPMISLQN